MFKRRILRALSERLPTGVHRDLVAMLYTTITPLILVGLLTTSIGLVVAHDDGAVAVAALAMASFGVTVGRSALLVAFKRQATARQMHSADVRRWERLYALGSVVTGLLLGTMNMLMSALIFGYGAGLVVRVSVRPRIYAASLCAAVLPSVVGLAMHFHDGAGHAVSYGAMALLYVAFAIGSAESARYLYRSTVSQLINARTLAGLARQDILTGLANRLLLRERFDESIASISSPEHLVALHLIDLDRFKPVNDRYGHPVGDALLKAVAARITAAIRPGDTAGRTGGDEFAVIQTGLKHEAQAEIMADRLATALAAPFDIDGLPVTIGATIGIAFAPRHGLDLDALTIRADEALYVAKEQSRGSVAMWSERIGKPIAA
jgi:diguanylate cyclase